MSEVLNSHQFYLQTKSFEDQAAVFAIQQAERLASQNQTLIKVNVVSRAICRQAYKMFKTHLEEAFPSPIYCDLITLTLQSRETSFFVDLKDRLITVFNDLNSQKMR